MRHQFVNKGLDTILNCLMSRYKERVPSVQKAIQAMLDKKIIHSEENIENDHIAFRTMGVPHLGITSLEKIFLHYGYKKMNSYDFKTKKVSAFWYSPPSSQYPRIFISELRVNEFPEEISSIIYSYTSQVTADPIESIDLDDAVAVGEFLHTPLWNLPRLGDYEKLLEVSEFASWVIYNRYYLNHFTVSVHNLPQGYNTITEFNDFLEGKGIRLNTSGGKIKTSVDGLLIQSSSVADVIKAQFDDGHGGKAYKKIAGSYVEFAERKTLPQFTELPEKLIVREHRRDGFDTGNADHIFESTYIAQTKEET